MNPLVQIAAQAGAQLLTSPRAPTQDQVNQAFALSQAATHRNLVIGGGLAVGAVLLYLFASKS